jgi:UrcA family protein
MTKSALLIAASVVAGAAAAQPRDTQPPVQTERVTYADLNLGSTASETALRRRIQIAAGHVCDTGAMRSTEEFVATAQCYRASFADGMRQMHALFASRAGKSLVAASAIVVASR